MKQKTSAIAAASLAATSLALLSFTTASAQELPKADGKPADMTRPVQVFILMGQSNMVGPGKITGPEGSLEHTVKVKNRYPYLLDDADNWCVRQDVRVYSNPLSLGGSGNSHYNGNAGTYMNVGEARGRTMVELLK